MEEKINVLATPTISTDEVYRGTNQSAVLTKELTDLERSIEALDDAKAPSTHTHANLEDAIEYLDSAVTELKNNSSGSGSAVTPMLELSMHLGKIDNNNGAELASSTRICSDPFPIENGKSYWQVNDKAVAMYVLVYDADEMFAGYLGKFESGAEIVVNVANAAYMRLSSLIGEYDLTNKFCIYDVDPNGGSSSDSTVDAYTKAESDSRFAAIGHAHTGYAAEDHTHAPDHEHSNKDVIDGITAEKVAAWDAGTGSGDPVTPVDAYTKTESDAKYLAKSEAQTVYAPVGHNHTDYLTKSEGQNTYAPSNHTHNGYAPSVHTHTDYMNKTEAQTTFAPINHSHNEYAYNDHEHLGFAPADHTHNGYALTNHDHSGYAPYSHSHSGYFSSNGGTISGDVNVNGLVRVNGQQCLFDSGDMVTLSTNNRKTMIAGSQVYSKTTVQVSSDARLKENVESINPDECVDFVKTLNVKQFNYIGDKTPCIGVIAQDVQTTDFGKFFVTVQPGEDGYLAIKAADFVFPLIATVQKLYEEIEMLKNK